MNPIFEALFIGPTFIVALILFANFQQVNTNANRWFSLFIMLVFIIQLEVLLYNTHLVSENSHINDVLNLSNYIVAPVFYFSIIYYIEPDRRWKWRDNLHFSFGGVMLLLTVVSFFVPVSASESHELTYAETTTLLIFTSIFCFQVLIYCGVAFVRLAKYQKNLLVYAADTDRIDLHWLKKIILCVIGIALLWLADGVWQISERSRVFDVISTLLYFFGICYIAYYALQQSELFPFKNEEKRQLNTIIDQTEARTENRKKLVTDEKLDEYVDSLEKLMIDKKPFLEHEISLISLAEQVDISPHLLSYVINAGLEENFFQFINRYRVEEAKRIILDPKMNHLSLVGIAFEAGFRSKTVFNTTFKKITGQTPSEYRKNQN